MFLDGLVEFMIGMSDPALTSVVVFCVQSRHCGESQYHRQYGP
jgi:hypothetical protein